MSAIRFNKSQEQRVLTIQEENCVILLIPRGYILLSDEISWSKARTYDSLRDM